MKRLTDKRLAIPPGVWQEVTREEARELKEIPVPSTRELYYRLSLYEDTGLEPEEIAKIREDVENGYLKSTARRYGISVDRLRELAEADREGRCMVVPSDYDGEMFKIWKGQILSSRRFVNNIKELGKTVFLTREEAEAALATDC